MKEKEEMEERMQLEEARSRSVFQKDGERGSMDFSRMRATDMKQNKRIFLPKDLEQELEAKMEVRRRSLMSA